MVSKIQRPASVRQTLITRPSRTILNCGEHGELDRDRVLQQRKNDLADARATTKNETVMKSQDSERYIVARHKAQTAEMSEDGKSPSPSRNPGLRNEQERDEEPKISEAKSDWEYQKFENADNEHLDVLMDMIGLESVKQQIIAIEAKVDACIR